MNTKDYAQEHRDCLGREVKVDDYVAFSHHNILYVGKVTKVTPKQVRVVPVDTRSWNQAGGVLKYTTQCCLVGGPELTYHVLKYG